MYLPDNLIYKLSSRLEKNKNIIALSPKVMFYDKPNLIWFRGAKIGFNFKNFKGNVLIIKQVIAIVNYLEVLKKRMQSLDVHQ